MSCAQKGPAIEMDECTTFTPWSGPNWGISVLLITLSPYGCSYIFSSSAFNDPARVLDAERRQGGLVNLPYACARKLGHDHDRSGLLVARPPLVLKYSTSSTGSTDCALGGNDSRGHCLPQIFIIDPEHCRLSHAGVSLEHAFHLEGVHVLAARLHHIVSTADKAIGAVSRLYRQIPGSDIHRSRTDRAR